MKALTSGLAVLIMAVAAGAAFAPPQPPGEGPAQPQMKMVLPAGPEEGFLKVANGNVTVMYKEGWKDVAEKMAATMSKTLSDMMGKASLEYTGTCEITLRPLPPDDVAGALSAPFYDPPKNLLRFPIAVAQGGAGAFSFDDMGMKATIFAILNSAVGMQLQASQPDVAVSTPRWFIHGLSLHLLAETAKEMAGDEWEQLVSLQFTDKMLEHYRETLLDWTSKQRGQFDPTYSMASAQIFVEIHKKFGPDAIKKIGAGYAKAQKVDKDSLVKIITDAIGEDFIAFLKGYVCPTKYAMLGVMTDIEYAEEGVRVGDVQPDSTASEAGVEAGDIIIKAAGKSVKNLAELKAVIDEAGAGGKLDLVVKRGDKEVELSGTLKERVFEFPPAPQAPAQPKPEPEPEPKTEPKPEGMSDQQRKDALIAVGFSDAQIEMLFKYFERAEPGELAKIDEATRDQARAFLLKAGFTEPQAVILMSVFRIDIDGAKSLPAVGQAEPKPNDDGKSAVDMIVELGFSRQMAERMVEVLKRAGRTEEEIKQLVREGKIKMMRPGEAPGQP